MPKKLQNYCGILFGILLFLPGQARSELKTPTSTWEQRAIDGNIVVSQWFDGVAEYIDLFLAGHKVTTNRNPSSFRIENASSWREGVGYKNSTSFNVNLRLPNFEESMSLKFTSYDEENENRGSQNAQFRQRPRDQNYGATIGLFRRLGNIRTAFQPRIELRDPLRVSHSLAFDTTVDMTPTSQFNPKIEFFANSEKGTGIFNQLNFGFQLNPIYSLSLINQSTYEDRQRFFTVSNGIALARPVLRTAGISYSFFLTSDNHGAYSLVGYSLATTWSQILYKNILDYNVTPHLDFSKDKSFTGRTAIDFNINLRF